MAKENVYYLSENNFNKLINTYKNPNQVSIFLKNTFNMNSYKRGIDSDKYNYVIIAYFFLSIISLFPPGCNREFIINYVNCSPGRLPLGENGKAPRDTTALSFAAA